MHLELEAAPPDRLRSKPQPRPGFYVRSLAHDIGVALGCGGYLQHLLRTAIGPYAADRRPAAGSAAGRRKTGGGHRRPKRGFLSTKSLCRLPEIELNSTAADRFIHGQEVVVFTTGVEDADVGLKRGRFGAPTIACWASASVRAVLARGRTLNITPAMVLNPVVDRFHRTEKRRPEVCQKELSC